MRRRRASKWASKPYTRKRAGYNKRYYATPRGRYSNARAAARKRNLAWNLSLSRFSEYLKQPCTYCGGPLTRYGSGLDRIDQKQGYREDNVLPACGYCNRLRGVALSVFETRALIAVLKVLRLERGLKYVWQGFKWATGGRFGAGHRN